LKRNLGYSAFVALILLVIFGVQWRAVRRGSSMR